MSTHVALHTHSNADSLHSKRSSLRRIKIGYWLGRVLIAGVSMGLLTGPINAAAAYAKLQSTQVKPPPAIAAQNEPQVHQLEPGKPIERELAGGETHSYHITLVSGQYLQGIIGQRQLDLTAALFGPDGQQVGQFDSRWYGPEPICFVAEVSGNYRLAIRPFHQNATRGSYQLKVEEPRTPTSQDRTRVNALKASTEGKQLIERGSAQSWQLATGKYEEALRLWRSIGDRFAEAQTLNSLGFLSGPLAGPMKALDYFNQALAIRQEIKDRDGEGETLNNIAAYNSALGRKEQALEYYKRALPLRRAGGDLVGEAQTVGNIGLTYFYLGETQKAIEQYNQSLPIWRASGNLAGEANALIGLGIVHNVLGERQQALDYLHRALQISRGAKDRRGEAYALVNICKIFEELGEHEKALDVCNQAIPLFRGTADRNGEASALNNLGAINISLGDKQKALDLYGQSLSIWRAVGDRFNEAYTLLNIGKFMYESGDKQKALEHYNQALSLFQTVKNPRGEAITLNNLGLLFVSLGEIQKGLDAYHRALPLWKEVGDRGGEAATLAHLAQVQRDLDNLTEARLQIESALNIIESLRVKIASQQLRASYFATTQGYHEFYIDLLMRLHNLQPSEGRNATALQASERARARGLLEMLTEASADINQGIDSTLLERERKLQQQLNARAEYQFRLLSDKHTREQMEAVKRELNADIVELQQVEASIRKTSPRYAELKYPQPLSLREIQQMLDSETLLLEYALGEERSYLWAVTPTTLDSFELPKRSVIEGLVTQAYKVMAEGETSAQKQARPAQHVTNYEESVAALSRVLLNPVASQLGKKRIVVVADGALQYIPFGVLIKPVPKLGLEAGADSKPLIVEHEIVSLPSASSLSVLRRELAGRSPAQMSVAVIADPVFEDDDVRIKKRSEDIARADNKHRARSGPEHEVIRSAQEVGATNAQQRLQRLVFSRREAEEIITLTPARTSFKALDFAANRSTVLGSNLSQYRIIHFATHGLLNSQHPELSGIVLSLVDKQGHSQDGFLRLHDIYNLKLGADLVVLSACQTGLGKEVRGEGLVGLTRGFLYAGAPRVVASLWKVDDRATAELMKQFYRRMIGDGLRPAAALRMAQISMLQQKRWAAPHYWAGFVLQGEWK